MPIKVNDIVTINTTYVAANLATQASDPLLRQTITSLDRLSQVSSTVLARGAIAEPAKKTHSATGALLYFIKVIPTQQTHISYRSAQDGAGRGVIIYFRNLTDLESSFQIVS